MAPAGRKTREEYPNTTNVKLLRQRFHVQKALPPGYHDCVVKLERIDVGELRASTENRSNKPEGYKIHIRRRSECEDTDEPEPIHRSIKIEYEDTPEGNETAAPSARFEIDLKQEVKMENADDSHNDASIASTSMNADICKESLTTDIAELSEERKILNDSLDKIISGARKRINFMQNESKHLRILGLKPNRRRTKRFSIHRMLNRLCIKTKKRYALFSAGKSI